MKTCVRLDCDNVIVSKQWTGYCAKHAFGRYRTIVNDDGSYWSPWHELPYQGDKKSKSAETA